MRTLLPFLCIIFFTGVISNKAFAQQKSIKERISSIKLPPFFKGKKIDLDDTTRVKPVARTKKIKIVDYPYHKSNVVYNIRSKGVIGGYCLVKGKVLNGRKGQVISDRYPMLDFYVKDNKLFTKDNKHIKIFHICEGLSYRTEEDELTYDESVNEIKTIWFNVETIEFFKNQCKCNF
jgi:hypothetical protein